MSKANGFEKFLEKTGISPRRTGGVDCTICALPKSLRAEVEELRTRLPAVSYGVIARYLNEDHSIRITDGAINGHFTKGHAKKGYRK